MRRKFKVYAADNTSAQDIFNDKTSKAKDDFNYIIDGLDKLAADGYSADANEVLETLQLDLDKAVEAIAAILA